MRKTARNCAAIFLPSTGARWPRPPGAWPSPWRAEARFCWRATADAQHWAAEFVNRFLMDRPPLPAIALTTDSSVLTSIGNDFGYDLVFTKQVQALGRPGDVFVGISTSGNSANVIGALQAARKQSLFTIGLTGDGGGRMAPLCDILLAVGHPSTPLVQETHAAIGHMLCALTDYYLFENVMAIKPMLD